MQKAIYTGIFVAILIISSYDDQNLIKQVALKLSCDRFLQIFLLNIYGWKPVYTLSPGSTSEHLVYFFFFIGPMSIF